MYRDWVSSFTLRSAEPPRLPGYPLCRGTASGSRRTWELQPQELGAIPSHVAQLPARNCAEVQRFAEGQSKRETWGESSASSPQRSSNH